MLRLSQQPERQRHHARRAGARASTTPIELCGPRELAAAGIEVVRHYEPAPPVRASATQLQEAFIQLIQNARAAMLRSGCAAASASRAAAAS